MNIVLWVFQILLALHTVMGAIWKFSNSEQAVPSLSAIPHWVWLGMSIAELACALCLVVPAIKKSLGALAPIAAICIAAEMISFCAVHLHSGDASRFEPIYWLVVATVCGLIAYGRLALRPIRSTDSAR